ncbi:MAG: glycosyltransferase, partial [Terriglobia bacterium]
MRILHVVPTYLPAYRYGGPIHSVHGLCKALAAAGHDVHVFTTNVDGPGNSAVRLGVPAVVDGVVVNYFASKILRRLFLSPPMASALDAEMSRFEIVHLHSIFLWPTWAAARRARRMGVPYVCAPRGMLVKELVRRRSRWLKSAWLALVERRNLEGAAAIHATSELERDDIREFHYRLPPIHVVPNGIEPCQDAAPAAAPPSWLSAIDPNQPVIAFIGRISWKKGLDRLLPALAHVPGAVLVVAGPDEDGIRPELEKLAQAKGVMNRVRFVGPVYGMDKLALLRRASVLAAPSYSENFGNVVLEAMAAGVPVVVTREVGLARTVESSGAGLVVGSSAEELGRALAAIAGDNALRQRMV